MTLALAFWKTFWVDRRHRPNVAARVSLLREAESCGCGSKFKSWVTQVLVFGSIYQGDILATATATATGTAMCRTSRVPGPEFLCARCELFVGQVWAETMFAYSPTMVFMPARGPG